MGLLAATSLRHIEGKSHPLRGLRLSSWAGRRAAGARYASAFITLLLDYVAAWCGLVRERTDLDAESTADEAVTFRSPGGILG